MQRSSVTCYFSLFHYPGCNLQSDCSINLEQSDRTRYIALQDNNPLFSGVFLAIIEDTAYSPRINAIKHM